MFTAFMCFFGYVGHIFHTSSHAFHTSFAPLAHLCCVSLLQWAAACYGGLTLCRGPAVCMRKWNSRAELNFNVYTFFIARDSRGTCWHPHSGHSEQELQQHSSNLLLRPRVHYASSLDRCVPDEVDGYGREVHRACLEVGTSTRPPHLRFSSLSSMLRSLHVGERPGMARRGPVAPTCSKRSTGTVIYRIHRLRLSHKILPTRIRIVVAP